jgi:hypothetical protein
MEKQIENILIKVDEGTMPVQQALSELLRLFGVSGLLCPRCNSSDILKADKENDNQCKDCNFVWG